MRVRVRSRVRSGVVVGVRVRVGGIVRVKVFTRPVPHHCNEEVQVVGRGISSQRKGMPLHVGDGRNLEAVVGAWDGGLHGVDGYVEVHDILPEYTTVGQSGVLSPKIQIIPSLQSENTSYH